MSQTFSVGALGGFGELAVGVAQVAEGIFLVRKCTGIVFLDVLLIAIPDSIESGGFGIHIGQKVKRGQASGVVLVKELVQMVIPWGFCSVGDTQCLDDGPGITMLV